MKLTVALFAFLILSFSATSQSMEVVGKMVVKDVNTIATFQSTVKNSFIRFATNNDPLRGANIGYFDDNFDKYFFIDTPEGEFGEFIIDTETSYIGFGLNPLTPFHFKCTSGDEFGMTIERGVNTDKWEISAFQGNLSFFYNGSLSPTSWIGTDGSYINPSDKRLKKDIKQYNDVLENVKSLNIINYRLNENTSNSKISLGIIAQDAIKLFPEIVSQNKSRDGQSYYGVNYAKLSVIALKAIQEQQEAIENLQKQNTQILSEKKVLQQKVDKLETKVNELYSLVKRDNSISTSND